MDLLGTTVLVTGASGGIGGATARAFASEGSRVVLTGRCLERLNELVKSIGEKRAMAVTADISDPLQVEDLLTKAQERFGSIDILVNNAGVGLVSNVQDMSADDLHTAIKVNLFGPLYTIQKTVPLMRKSGGGVIINVSSMITRIATMGNGGYRATKMALDALSDALRLELKRERIRVVTVYPGLTDSDFFHHSLGKRSSDGVVSVRKFRYKPEQVASKIIHAACKEPRVVYMGIRGRIGGLAGQIFPGILENLMMLKKRFL